MVEGMELFPLNVGTSEVRGLVKMVKDAGGSTEISKIVRETNEKIDNLFPVIDAVRLLGLCTVNNGIITLTDQGKQLTIRNITQMFAKELVNVEPFKSIMAIIDSNKSIVTAEISKKLHERDISFNTDELINIDLLKDLLLKWAVRAKLLVYDPKADAWHMK